MGHSATEWVACNKDPVNSAPRFATTEQARKEKFLRVKDIADAAQGLADYCYRKGEGADLRIIEGSLKQTGERLTILQQERQAGVAEDLGQFELELTRETVTK